MKPLRWPVANDPGRDAWEYWKYKAWRSGQLRARADRLRQEWERLCYALDYDRELISALASAQTALLEEADKARRDARGAR